MSSCIGDDGKMVILGFIRHHPNHSWQSRQQLGVGHVAFLFSDAWNARRNWRVLGRAPLFSVGQSGPLGGTHGDAKPRRGSRAFWLLGAEPWANVRRRRGSCAAWLLGCEPLRGVELWYGLRGAWMLGCRRPVRHPYPSRSPMVGNHFLSVNSIFGS